MLVTGAKLIACAIPTGIQTVTAKEAILYACSVGYASDPTMPGCLTAIYEQGLRPVPTLANVIANPGPVLKPHGVDWKRVVHAQHRLVVHREIPIGVPLRSSSRMLSVVDRGVHKGMFASFERVVYERSVDDPVATIVHTDACRGDGGCGSAGVAPEPLPRVPNRSPDQVRDLNIPISAAAFYRLNGDLNPLHIDPTVAGDAGFPRPILHGLATLGHAGYVITRLASMHASAVLTSIATKFTAPFYPAETLRTQIWYSGSNIQFRCTAVERDIVVLDCGTATILTPHNT